MRERWERQRDRAAKKEAQAEFLAVRQSFRTDRGLGALDLLRAHRKAKDWLKWAKAPTRGFDDHDVYGQPLPSSAGTFRHRGHYLWTTRLTPVATPAGEPAAEQYQASFAVALCEGEQGALRRVWMNGMLVLDRAQSGTGYATAPDFSNKIVFYPGSESQTASPTIEEDKGIGNVPAYRGTCYLVCREIPLGRFGNSLPEVEAEVVGAATPDYTTGDVADFTEPATSYINHWVISRLSPWIYQFDTGTLRCIRKDIPQQRRAYDVQAVLNGIAGSLSVTTFVVEESSSAALDTIYFLCESAGGDFLLRFDGQSWANSYAERVNGRVFRSGIVVGGRLFVSDSDNSQVHCFDTDTLDYLWTADTGLGGIAEAGTWTYDNHGRLWTVWFDSSDTDSLYLSRVSYGGALVNYRLTDEALLAARGVAYDVDSGHLVTGGVTGNRLSKILVSAAGVPSYVASETDLTCNNSRALFEAQRRFSRVFYTTEDNRIYARRVSSWIDASTVSLSNYDDTGTGDEAYGYDYLTRAVWICRDAAPGMSMLPLDRDSGAGTTLDALVSSLCTESGLVAGDLDVTAAAGVDVQGHTLPGQTTAKDPITQLLTAYQYGVREHYENGYSQIKLEFVDRAVLGTATTIDPDEMGLGVGAPEDPVIAEERTREDDLPRVVRVRYADTRRNYSAHHQASEVPADVTSSEEELELSFPNLVLTDGQAKQLADKILSSAWSEGVRYVFSVPLEYLVIEPEDTLALTLESDELTLRAEEVELSEDYIVTIAAVLSQPDLYESSAAGEESPLSGVKPEVLTPSSLILVDCPAVRDIDGAASDAGLYVFGAPQDEDDEWPGVGVWRSTDGSHYVQVATITQGATWGSCMDTLADGDVTVFDAGSTLTVQLAHGEISTATEAALAEDPLLNLAGVGTERGGWELVQFATVTDNLDGTYTLTGMRRGRFGTEFRAASHGSGETFVLFDFETPTTQRLSLGLRERSQNAYYKGLTVGAAQQTASGRIFVNDAESLMPYASRDLSGVLSGGDWTLNWTRRTRIGGGLSDYTDVALNEVTEEYEIDIRESPTGPVIRTLTVGPGLPSLSGVNLSVDATTSKFVRASGSWLTDGWLVGQRVESAGFSNAGNNSRWTISALTATDMTVTSGSTTLVTEGAAAGRTMTAVTPAVQYTAAQQTADGGAKGSFYAEVYQISDTLRDQDGVGRGFTEQVQIS